MAPKCIYARGIDQRELELARASKVSIINGNFSLVANHARNLCDHWMLQRTTEK